MMLLKKSVCLLLVVLFLLQMPIGINVMAAESTMSPLQSVIIEGLNLPDGVGDGTRMGLGTLLSGFLDGEETLDNTVNKIKNVYFTSMNEADIKEALTKLNELSSNTKKQITAIINKPHEIASSDGFPKIRAKINKDITTDSNNDKGLLLMYNVLDKANYGLRVFKDFEGCLVTDGNDKTKICFNRLNKYDNSKVELNELLGTIASLPFEPKTFDGFVENYEGFINQQTPEEIKAFKEFLNGPNGDAGIYVPIADPVITPIPTETPEITPIPETTPTVVAESPTPTTVTESPTPTTVSPTPTKKHRGGGGSYIAIADQDTVLGSTKDLKVKIVEVDISKLSDAQKGLLSVNDVVYEVSMEDGSKVNSLGRLSLPYTLKPGEDPRKVSAFLIAADDKLKNKIGEYDDVSKSVKIITNELGYFVVKYNNITYSDLGNFGWAKDFVEVLSSKGIIYGVGDDLYAPDKVLTRAEFAALIVRAFNLGSEDASSNFTDVDKNAWYYKEVSAAVKAGLIIGRPDNTFAPEDILSRQDMSVIISKVLTTYLGEKLETTDAEINKFTDKGDIADYAKQYVATVVKYGIMVGEPSGEFNPQSSTNRAQAAVATYKLFNY